MLSFAGKWMELENIILSEEKPALNPWWDTFPGVIGSTTLW
jgi:hypothetical protein